MKSTMPKKICAFFMTQKNPCDFHRPTKNPFWPKFQTQKSRSDLTVKYVSGAPGEQECLRHILG